MQEKGSSEILWGSAPGRLYPEFVVCGAPVNARALHASVSTAADGKVPLPMLAFQDSPGNRPGWQRPGATSNLFPLMFMVDL